MPTGTIQHPPVLSSSPPMGTTLQAPKCILAKHKDAGQWG